MSCPNNHYELTKYRCGICGEIKRYDRKRKRIKQSYYLQQLKKKRPDLYEKYLRTNRVVDKLWSRY